LHRWLRLLLHAEFYAALQQYHISQVCIDDGDQGEEMFLTRDT